MPLIGGLVLFGGAIATLFGSLRRLVAVPATVGLVVLLLVLVWSLGQAVAATNPPRPQLGSRTPADLGLTYRNVEFRAADGVRLSGWFIPSRNRAAVVLLHGAGSTRSNVLDHAGVLARHGYGVLLYDARGHGRSQGRAMDFGWYGDNDINGAIAFLRHQPNVDPRRLAAVGLSMGGEEAIGASAANEDIHAVVAEGATNRVAGDKAWMSDTYGIRGALTEDVEALTYGFADLLTDAKPPVTLHDAVRRAARDQPCSSPPVTYPTNTRRPLHPAQLAAHRRCLGGTTHEPHACPRHPPKGMGDQGRDLPRPGPRHRRPGSHRMKTDNAGVRSSVGLRTDDEPSSDKPDRDESERTRPGGRADGSGEGRLV